MTRRRAALLFFTAAVACADERSDVVDAVTPLASALSNGDADAFLDHIPPDFPNRSQLVDYIRGLLAQAEMTCSVQIRSVENGRAELDWYMEIRSRRTSSVLERRKQIVVAQVRNRKIINLEPLDFFKPADVR